MTARPQREVDLAERTERLTIGISAAVAGLAAGAALGFFLFRWPPLAGALVFGLPCGLVAFAVAYLLVEGSGRVVGGLHSPSGSPRRTELSREEALIVAGRYEEAAAALVEAAKRDPKDPRPLLRLAELYRDEIGDYEAAVAWYRRAAALPGLSVESQRMLLRELIELCRDRMNRPELAAPALARTAQLHEGDRLGHWARAQLREIKGA
ncbi:MAG: hypothetical protein R3266_06535 [Gemmatimonadota bacterium]|nr:hypothetical protein [Gemmatimonadota bacterium]